MNDEEGYYAIISTKNNAEPSISLPSRKFSVRMFMQLRYEESFQVETDARAVHIIIEDLIFWMSVDKQDDSGITAKSGLIFKIK